MTAPHRNEGNALNSPILVELENIEAWFWGSWPMDTVRVYYIEGSAMNKQNPLNMHFARHSAIIFFGCKVQMLYKVTQWRLRSLQPNPLMLLPRRTGPNWAPTPGIREPHVADHHRTSSARTHLGTRRWFFQLPCWLKAEKGLVLIYWLKAKPECHRSQILSNRNTSWLMYSSQYQYQVWSTWIVPR